MKLRRLVFPWCLLVTLLLSACAPAAPGPAQAPSPVPAPVGAQPGANVAQTDAAWPMTITDAEGRTVVVPAQPRRVISLAPSNTEILFALGLGERVVGTDAFSDYPAAAQHIARVGDLMNPDHERLIALQPDLILAIAGSRKLWEKAADQGVPVVVIQPRDLASVLDSIRQVGQITGVPTAAERLVAELQSRIDGVRDQVQDVRNHPRVFYEIWYDPLMAAGPGSFMDDLIRIAGGTNVVQDTQNAFPEVSLEAMVAADPEVILANDADWVARVRSGELKAWQVTAAARAERVVHIDPNLTSRPGPRLVDGLEAVARALHPDLAGVSKP